MRILLKCKEDNHTVDVRNCERFELSTSKCIHNGALSWTFYFYDKCKRPRSLKASDYKFIGCVDDVDSIIISDIDIKIISDLVKDRSLDEMRCCYGAEFIENYDFYNNVAERLNTYLFVAD